MPCSIFAKDVTFASGSPSTVPWRISANCFAFSSIGQVLESPAEGKGGAPQIPAVQDPRGLHAHEVAGAVVAVVVVVVSAVVVVVLDTSILSSVVTTDVVEAVTSSAF